jgi:hypothetical protein
MAQTFVACTPINHFEHFKAQIVHIQRFAIVLGCWKQEKRPKDF